MGRTMSKIGVGVGEDFPVEEGNGDAARREQDACREEWRERRRARRARYRAWREARRAYWRERCGDGYAAFRYGRGFPRFLLAAGLIALAIWILPKIVVLVAAIALAAFFVARHWDGRGFTFDAPPPSQPPAETPEPGAGEPARKE